MFCSVWVAQAPAMCSLRSILELGIGDRLPLHVAGRIRPASAERHHMVDHVARAAASVAPGHGAGLLALEFGHSGVAARVTRRAGQNRGRRQHGQRQNGADDQS